MSESKHLNHLPGQLLRHFVFSFHDEKYQKSVQHRRGDKFDFPLSGRRLILMTLLLGSTRLLCWFWNKLMQHISALLLLTTFPSFPSQRNIGALLNSMTKRVKSVSMWLEFPA